MEIEVRDGELNLQTVVVNGEPGRAVEGRGRAVAPVNLVAR